MMTILVVRLAPMRSSTDSRPSFFDEPGFSDAVAEACGRIRELSPRWRSCVAALGRKRRCWWRGGWLTRMCFVDAVLDAMGRRVASGVDALDARAEAIACSLIVTGSWCKGLRLRGLALFAVWNSRVVRSVSRRAACK